MSWKRAITFSVILLIIPAIVGFVSGFTMTDLWRIYGETYPGAADNARTVRRVVIGVVYYLTYLAFLRSQAGRTLFWVFAVFIAVELAAVVVELALWGKPMSEAIYWPATLRHVATALLAVGTVHMARRMSPNSSFKPTSLRDVA